MATIHSLPIRHFLEYSDDDMLRVIIEVRRRRHQPEEAIKEATIKKAVAKKARGKAAALDTSALKDAIKSLDKEEAAQVLARLGR